MAISNATAAEIGKHFVEHGTTAGEGKAFILLAMLVHYSAHSEPFREEPVEQESAATVGAPAA